MKVRMQSNSIRYRLRQPEVHEFKLSGIITETIQLGIKAGSFLRFVLQKGENKYIEVQFDNNTTIVQVPKHIADDWTNTSSVGFDAAIELDNGKSLKILVEKDFECMDDREEENVGAYPNPKKS